MRSTIDNIRNFAIIVAGAPFAAAMGDVEFWRVAQTDRGPLGKLAMGYITRQKKLFRNYWMLQSDVDRDSLSDLSKASYSDDELHGFASKDFWRGGGRPLEEQQRGLILPVVEGVIADRHPGRVLEIGTGNGDISAWFAKRHDDVHFTGIDFSVKHAAELHSANNLTFLKGYALDLLEAGQVKGDLLFASSTFVLFTPAELRRYLRAIVAAGFTDICLSEPTFRYDQFNDGRAFSHHIDNAMWFHNYAGYLRDAGFHISDHFCTMYTNPNGTAGRVVLLRGQR